MKSLREADAEATARGRHPEAASDRPVGTSEDISLVYHVGRAVELGLPPSPETQGTAGLREWRLKVSVIYRIANTEKLGGFLKKGLRLLTATLVPGAYDGAVARRKAAISTPLRTRRSSPANAG